MKAQVANYQYRALCLRIEPVTGAVVRITNYLYDLKMSNGDVYLSSSGYDFTGYQTGTTASPSMVDIQGILGLAGIGVDQLQSGVYDGARCYLFACEWNNPMVDYEPIVASILGKTHILDQKYMIEEMSLSDALGQSIGETYQPLCQKQLGSTVFAGCKVDLAPHTFTGAITSVVDSKSFGSTDLTQAADYFKAGLITFTSGANAGLKGMEIKAFALGGALETYEAFYYTPQIGDTFTIIAGCQKRLSDCRDKFANVLNYGGFPNIPVSTTYTQVGG